MNKKFSLAQLVQVVHYLVAIVLLGVSVVVPMNVAWVKLFCLISVLLIGVNFFINKYVIRKTIKEVSDDLKQLAQGKSIEIPSNKVVKNHMFRHLNAVSQRYTELSKYVEAISSGEGYKQKYVNQNDGFGQAIVKLNQYLEKLVSEEEDWKAQEEKRNWMNQGIARFSEIMRQANLSINELAQQMLGELIKYVDCNQGGVFIKDDIENDYLSMIAAYAYDRNKFPDKKCMLDDGLIAAACFEKASIFMTDIPEDYLSIRSGMGEASPKCLFIVPLITDDKVMGVIELASFEIIDEHKRKFVEKIAETFSATLSASHLNSTTVKLLEKAQVQAEKLKQQEEELRQNIEEMRAQQEEMENKQHELEASECLMRKIIDLVPYPIFVKNNSRQYIVANQAEGHLYNMPVESLLGHSDDDLVNDIDELNAIHRSDSKVLDENQMIKLPEQAITLPDGTKRILQTIKVPFVNNITNLPNILGVSFDLTTVREMEQQLKDKDDKLKELEEMLKNKK